MSIRKISCRLPVPFSISPYLSFTKPTFLSRTEKITFCTTTSRVQKVLLFRVEKASTTGQVSKITPAWTTHRAWLYKETLLPATSLEWSVVYGGRKGRLGPSEDWSKDPGSVPSPGIGQGSLGEGEVIFNTWPEALYESYEAGSSHLWFRVQIEESSSQHGLCTSCWSPKGTFSKLCSQHIYTKLGFFFLKNYSMYRCFRIKRPPSKARQNRRSSTTVWTQLSNASWSHGTGWGRHVCESERECLCVLIPTSPLLRGHNCLHCPKQPLVNFVDSLAPSTHFSSQMFATRTSSNHVIRPFKTQDGIG